MIDNGWISAFSTVACQNVLSENPVLINITKYNYIVLKLADYSKGQSSENIQQLSKSFFKPNPQFHIVLYEFIIFEVLECRWTKQAI